MAYLILIAFVIFIIFIIPVKLEVIYYQHDNRGRLKYRIYYVFNITIYNNVEEYNLDLDNILNKKDLQREKVEKREGFANQISFYKKMIEWLRVKLVKLKINSVIGFTDPALTAIFYGWVWIVIGQSLYQLKKRKTVTPSIKFTPFFQGRKISVKIKGIFNIYPGNIILTGGKLIYYRWKGGFLHGK